MECFINTPLNIKNHIQTNVCDWKFSNESEYNLDSAKLHSLIVKKDNELWRTNVHRGRGLTCEAIPNRKNCGKKNTSSNEIPCKMHSVARKGEIYSSTLWNVNFWFCVWNVGPKNQAFMTLLFLFLVSEVVFLTFVTCILVSRVIMHTKIFLLICFQATRHF